MSVNQTFNNIVYPIPVQGDLNWGPNLTRYLVALGTYALAPSGGLFTLTADVNLGPSFGILGPYFASVTTHPATAGMLRLAKTDAVEWRNNANSGNLSLAINGSDQLTFNGAPLNTGLATLTDGKIWIGNSSNIPTEQTLTGDITVTDAGVTSIGTGVITNAEINAAAAIAYSKLSLAGSIRASDIASGQSPTFNEITINNNSGLLLQDDTNTHNFLLKTPSSISANRTYTIPDAGANATFLMDHGTSQSINGNLSVVFMTATEYLLSNGGFLTAINTDHASGSPQNTIIPDTGSGSTSHFVVTETAQTLNGTYTFPNAPVLNTSALATSGTIVPDARVGPTLTIAVSGAVTIDGPTNGVHGQKITFMITNDASHSVTFATGAGNFKFGTDITSYTNSVSLIDFVGAIYDAGASLWYIVSVIQGF